MSIPKKPEANYMLISFNISYDSSFVLPYKEGIAFLAALENAKIYKKAYSEESKIIDVSNDTVKSSSIGAQEYGEAILRTTLLPEGSS